MKQLLLLLLFTTAASLGHTGTASEARFSFGVLASGSIWANEEALREAFTQSDAANLAFVVAQGIKSATQPCRDNVYQRRKNLLESSKHGLIVSPAAGDWVTCESENGASAAIGKLTRIRDLFFVNEFSFGATKLPLVRQSTEAKFHNFVENARWEIGDVMFATINLPAKNNHFVAAAGRNGEFEDRLVANREWLRRVFTYADLKKLDAIVLFSDANPLMRTAGARRDGFAETRRHIIALSTRFKGKVLIVHAQPQPTDNAPAIRWRGNVGDIGVARGWLKLRVEPNSSALFVPGNPARKDQ